jgi:uncharacterized membrane protein YhhN
VRGLEAEDMTLFEAAATLSCVTSCAQLVWIERQLADRQIFAHPAAAQLELRRRMTKIMASLSFVLLAYPALSRGAFGTWMFVGLVAGAAGDVALLGRGTRAFVIGLVAFLIGHVAYVIGIAQVVPVTRWLPEAGLLAVLPIAVAAAALRLLWPKLGGLRGPVIAYVATIVAMVIGAFAARASYPLLALGAALFFASDLAVARDRFLARDFANKLYGLPAYYAGQLLIAWAVR